MESQATTSKKKQRALKPVTVLCSKCRQPFTTKARAHLCPACRPQKKQSPTPAPPLPVVAPKPQRVPRKPRQPRAPIAQETRLSRAMETMVLNPASRLANRTTQNSSLLKPRAGARTAIERLMLQTLDPASACGQKPILVNVDQIQLPKYPIQFDTNFVVTAAAAEASYKIMLSASPVVAAVIVSGSALVVSGARSISLPDSTGTFITTYVLNNKLGFLADLNSRFEIQPKDDFRRFRMIAASMQSQWAGPEILKSGIAITARLTDKENLVDFDPNQKADNVISNNSDVLITTCQHAEPVFEFSSVDTNNDDGGGGGLPDPHIGNYATYTYTISAKLAILVDDGFTVEQSPLTGLATATIGDYSQQVLANMSSELAASTTHLAAAQDVMNTLTSKYPNFENFGASRFSYACDIAATLEVALLTPSPTARSFKISLQQQNLPNLNARNLFFAQLCTLLSNAALAANNTVFGTLGGVLNEATLNLEVRIPTDGKINQRVTTALQLVQPLLTNRLNRTPFYDDSWLQPVTQVTSGGSPLTIQYQTSHSFEFVLSDTTVLATNAVANSPKDPESVVSKTVFDKYQKMMKGMPPAHIMSDVGATRATCSQFASRGILNDIFKLAAPIAGTIFPGIRPILGAAKPLVEAIDSAM